MIHPKYAGLLMSLIISFGMSLVMSFSMMAINVGFIENFGMLWMKAWATSFPVAFPTASLMVPMARKLVVKITGAPLGQ